ncbi:MAG: hypothetical protein AABW51_05165 [Nanoarchaeota archaeon]
MKKVLSLSVLLLILPFTLALNLQVDKISKNEVMIVGVEKPATFDFNITNPGPATKIQFYNLLSFRMLPSETILINAYESKIIKLEISPIGDFNFTGLYSFPFYIRDVNDESEMRETLTFRRVEFRDAFEIGAGSFNPESNSVDIYLQNMQNFKFGEINGKFSSSFFNIEKTFTLAPYERKNFTIQLNKEDFKQLLAGSYTLNADLNAEGQKTNIQTNLEFIEKDIIKTSESQSGLIFRTNVITKTNVGNVLATENMVITKNIISRLFTTFSPEPDSVDRSGFIVKYGWSRELKPGESFEITVKTNWLFPLLLILLVIAAVIIAKQYTSTNLVINKKINFVRAKGGEFALKVSVILNAKKHVDNITVIDRLPPLVTLYEKFGIEKPSRVDTKLRKLEWNFNGLEAGETRVISYIIYSKVGIMGKFSLPPTTAIFERNGQAHETESNRAFFVAEPRSAKDFQNEF